MYIPNTGYKKKVKKVFKDIELKKLKDEPEYLWIDISHRLES
tara:strand:- start:521 stop:646 length:126 start_codon:yes stop_codon:yes gene_type:complete